MLKETIGMDQLGSKVMGAAEELEFAGVVALTRTAGRAKRAVQDILPERFIIRNKWTIRGIRITPATKKKPEAEVYSKDWYMPIHEEGGRREPKGETFWIPVNIRNAIGKSAKDMIPVSMRPKNILKKKVHGNLPFVATYNGKTGIFVKTGDPTRPVEMLYYRYDKAIKIEKQKWFFDEIFAIYDKYMDVEYNRALQEAFERGVKGAF